MPGRELAREESSRAVKSFSVEDSVEDRNSAEKLPSKPYSREKVSFASSLWLIRAERPFSGKGLSLVTSSSVFELGMRSSNAILLLPPTHPGLTSICLSLSSLHPTVHCGQSHG